jgi:rhodanese-related sulfurtransferase
MERKSAKDLVAEAGQHVETLSGEQALKLAGRRDVVFVDVREGEELQKTGKLEGALHVPRGLLEFQADPASPAHKPEFGDDKKLVLYCGSGSRGVAALQQAGGKAES